MNKGFLFANIFAVTHAIVVLLFAHIVGYRFNLDGQTKYWIYIGLYISGLVPAVFYFFLGLILPFIIILFALILLVRAEYGHGPGEPLGAIYLRFWPLFVGAYIISAICEILIRMFT